MMRLLANLFHPIPPASSRCQCDYSVSPRRFNFGAGISRNEYEKGILESREKYMSFSESILARIMGHIVLLLLTPST
jgi:hypothetical protein